MSDYGVPLNFRPRRVGRFAVVGPCAACWAWGARVLRCTWHLLLRTELQLCLCALASGLHLVRVVSACCLLLILLSFLFYSKAGETVNNFYALRFAACRHALLLYDSTIYVFFYLRATLIRNSYYLFTRRHRRNACYMAHGTWAAAGEFVIFAAYSTCTETRVVQHLRTRLRVHVRSSTSWCSLDPFEERADRRNILF